MFTVYEVQGTSRFVVGQFCSREVASMFVMECIQSRECGHFFIVSA